MKKVQTAEGHGITISETLEPSGVLLVGQRPFEHHFVLGQHVSHVLYPVRCHRMVPTECL